MMGQTQETATVKPILVSALPAEAGLRLDRFLTGRLQGLTRSRVQSLIRGGHVAGPAGTISDAASRVKPGERYEVRLPQPVAGTPEPQRIPLKVVFEDEHLIVVDKPAGLVVHPAAGHACGTLVNALLAHCGASLSGIGGVKRPGIVHRLDKDTSGLLVVAKSDAAHQRLREQFAAHGADGRLHRAYLALVWGVPQLRSGTIDARLGRSPANRTRMAVLGHDRGRRAVTHYEVLEEYGDSSGRPVASLLRVRLETGRTHQIRVHLAHAGHPVMGDPTYGAGFKASSRRLGAEARAALEALGRQALHAAELGFEHPVTRKHPTFKSAPAPEMARLTAALRAQWAKAPRPGRRR
jgi:23S rRNA pseudouridine1911/1915/1917 synthase